MNSLALNKFIIRLVTADHIHRNAAQTVTMKERNESDEKKTFLTIFGIDCFVKS